MVTSARVGNVEVRVFLDAAPPPFPPEAFFPDVPLSAWQPYREQHLDPEGKFRTNFCAFLVRSAGRTVLVDTGVGPGPHAALGGIRGELVARLREAGIAREDVETVVITHLHSDHVGWNVSHEGAQPRAAFPRARYLLPRGDWEFYTSPQQLEKAPYIRSTVLPLGTLGVLDLVEGDHAVTGELTTLSTPGHTPGHLSVLISSAGEKGIIVGDLFHSAAQVTEPDWNSGFDADKEQARRIRHEVLDRLEQEGYTVAAGHLLIDSNIGRVVRLEGRRFWQPL